MSAFDIPGGTLLMNKENVLWSARGSPTVDNCFDSSVSIGSSSAVSFSFSSVVFSLLSFTTSLTGVVSSTASFFSDNLLESSFASSTLFESTCSGF